MKVSMGARNVLFYDYNRALVCNSVVLFGPCASLLVSIEFVYVANMKGNEKAIPARVVALMKMETGIGRCFNPVKFNLMIIRVIV